MNALFFIAAVTAVGAAALLFAASLRLASAVSALLAAYLIASAEVVLLGEALSLVHAVSRSAYAGGEAVALAGAAAVWHTRGRPRLALPRTAPGGLRRHPILLVLGAVVAAALAYQAFLVLATPPNNWDSMTYHLSRAAYWLQHGGIAYVPDAHTERQNAFPPNSELAILYTFALLRGDSAAALPQLAAEAALLLAVTGLARRVRFSRPAAVFAGLLAATLPEVALQATTTQNDLTVAALVAAAAYFVLGTTGTEFGLAGVALGLGLGTKPTVSFALPALVAIAALSLPVGRALARAAAVALAAFVLLGAYGYVLNVVETGRVFGDPAAVTGLQPEQTFGGTISTTGRLVYRFFDLSGLGRATAWTGPVERAGEAVFDALGIEPNPPEATTAGSAFSFRVNVRSDPDLSYYGALGVLLILPLTLAFVWMIPGGPARAILALSVPLTVVMVALTYRYNDFVGRFLLTPVALVMPLAAWVYRWRALAAAAAAVGVAGLTLAHAYDVAKPTGLGGTVPVWELSRAEAQGLTRIGMPEVLEVIGRRIPERAPVGVILGNDDWDYPLYGPKLARRLVPLPRVGALEQAESRGLRWVVVGATPPGPAYLPGWQVRFFPVSEWTLLRRA